MRLNSSPTPASIYTWRNFWRGYLDWLNEQIHGPAPAVTPEPMNAPRQQTLWWLVLVIPAGILLVALLAPLLAPVVVQGMHLAGTEVVASLSMWLAVVTGVAFAIGFPMFMAIRLNRFVKRCCERGAELASGLRPPAWPR